MVNISTIIVTGSAGILSYSIHFYKHITSHIYQPSSTLEKERFAHIMPEETLYHNKN
ncbi:hypothetical protein EMIT0210MI2_12990 [Priestia megaterium]